jgi:DinB superfamily
MRIPELQQKIKESHATFIKCIIDLSDADFLKPTNDKWTAGQQLEHIVMAVAPVNQAFGLPGFMLKMLFGKANRPSRSYDQLVEKYHDKLVAGGRASRRFVPASVILDQRNASRMKLEKLVRTLTRRIGGFSEEQLDQLILPHPLLGKLTLREMIYFTIYHAGHHEKQVINNLE